MHSSFKSSFLAFFIFYVGSSYAQIITFQGTNLFNRHNTGYTIINTTDTASSGNHYLMAGTLLQHLSADSTDIQVLYTNANGNILWEKTYNTGHNERCLNAAKTNDGYILTGYSDTGSVNNRLFLLHIDLNGNILAQRYYESPLSGHTQGLGVKPSADNGYIVAGFLNEGYDLPDSKKALVMKVDSNLLPQWSHYYNTPWDTTRDLDMAESLIEIPGQGYFITGSVNIPRYDNVFHNYYMTDQGVLALMLDLSGNLLWNSSFTEQDSTVAGHWCVGVKPYFDPDSNLIYLMSNNTQSHQFAMTVFDLTGNIVHQWDYDFLLDGIAGFDLREGSNSSTLVACGIATHLGFQEDVNYYTSNFPPVLLEFNKSNGSQLWSKYYKVPSEFYSALPNGFYTPLYGQQPLLFTPDMLAPTGDGGYAIAAYRSNASAFHDLELIKTDQHGKVGCPFDTLQFSPVSRNRYIHDSLAIESGITADTIVFQVDTLPRTSNYCSAPDTCVCNVAAGFSYTPVIDHCTYQFTDTSTVDSCYFICSRDWDFGDGNFSSDANPVHSFNTAGWYVVCLWVFACSEQGQVDCQGMFCDSIYVSCDTCHCEIAAGFTYTLTGNCTYEFHDTSTIDTLCYSICSRNWDFGDGNFSSSENPTHTFTSSGLDTVCLTVMSCDDFGIDNCDTTICEIFDLPCLPIGFEDANDINALVYPNPFSGIANIGFSRPVNGMIRLYDALGREVFRQKAVGKNISLRPGDIPSGVYSLILEERGRVIAHLRIGVY